jgi:hypothetical protein
MHLKSYNVGPPGGWRYTCPFCGDPPVISVGITFHQLVQRVHQHYTNMNHPYGDLTAEIDAGICASLSPADKVAYCDMGVRHREAVAWGEIYNFMMWLGKWLLGGTQLVSQEEAERRASICASCPYNVPTSGCATCRTSIGVLRNKLMRVSSSQDDKLEACGICGCDLKTIVHVPLETLSHRGLEAEYQQVPWCWQKKS